MDGLPARVRAAWAERKVKRASSEPGRSRETDAGTKGPGWERLDFEDEFLVHLCGRKQNALWESGGQEPRRILA